MTSRAPLPRPAPLLLCAALALLACDPLRELPDPLPPEVKEPPPPPLTVKLVSDGPEYCREGRVTFVARLEGGTPTSVILHDDEGEIGTLTAPYHHTVDCAALREGRYSFVAVAWDVDRSSSSEPVSLVVDRTAPRADAWRKKPGLPSADKPVEIAFSEPLDPSSVQDPATLRDSHGDEIPYQASLSTDGKVLRLVPTRPLDPLSWVSVFLYAPSLTDLAGNRATASVPSIMEFWPFASLGPPLNDEPVDELTFVLDPRGKGRPVAAFLDYRTDIQDRVLGVARWSGSAWEHLPPPRTEAERAFTLYSDSGFQLQVGPTGEPVLAWCQLGDSTAQVLVKRFDGTSWHALGAPYDAGNTHCGYIRMTLDSSGNPVIVHDLRWYDLRVARWDGAAWVDLGAPINANATPKTIAFNPAIAVDASGKVVLAWSEVPEGGSHYRLFIQEYEQGVWSSLGAPLQGTLLTDTYEVDLTLDRQGNPLVAWTETASSTGDEALYFSRRQGAAGWSSPELLERIGSSDSLRVPLLALDAEGEPWVAWALWESGNSRKIYYRRHRASGWESKEFVSSGYLGGFRLDEDGVPWVGAFFNIYHAQPNGPAILRPQ